MSTERIEALLHAKCLAGVYLDKACSEFVALSEYDLVVVNSSGGKDSIAALWQIIAKADKEGYDRGNIVVSHQDLGNSEWPGVTDLVRQQCAMFGLALHISRRRNERGEEETLLQYAQRRGKWPSNKQRWCTSDFKRAPGARVVTQLTKGMKAARVLHVFGFRREESPARSKRAVLSVNKTLTTNSREVHDFLPIHDWSVKKVWETIRGNAIPYHYAYDLGMPRLSCVFCIFAPKEALVLAGKNNPALLDEYVKVENAIGHTFRENLSLADVKALVESDYATAKIADWTM